MRKRNIIIAACLLTFAPPAFAIMPSLNVMGKAFIGGEDRVPRPGDTSNTAVERTNGTGTMCTDGRKFQIALRKAGFELDRRGVIRRKSLGSTTQDL
jgi:hypothetical protein